MYWFIHWFIRCSLNFFLYVYLFLFLYPFISGTVFIFMFICSYFFIHSLQAQLLSSCLFVLMYWFIHCTLELMTSEEKLKKLDAQPSFKQLKIFHEKLVAVERAKVELTLNRPIYAGFAILDLSKTLMYDFHYNYIKRKHRDSTLLFTDTDSLKYQL